MQTSNVSPELHAQLRKMPAQDLRPGWRRLMVQTALALFPSPKTAGASFRKAPELRGSRLYMPERRAGTGALLWIHGGGYVIGRAVMDHLHCAQTAAELGIPVLSVEYRLAPGHPFPAPLEDCHAAWRWLQKEAAGLGIDPHRIAVGGQSAGGGLAAGLIQKLMDGEGPKPSAQWLFCPMLDDRTAARRELDAPANHVWNNQQNLFGWRAYLGVEPGSAEVAPYAAPARRVDLRGLPPAWIGVGDIDLFFEEDRAYAQRLAAAGVEAAFEIAPGAPHGFESWARDTALARTHLAKAHDWLRRALS